RYLRFRPRPYRPHHRPCHRRNRRRPRRRPTAADRPGAVRGGPLRMTSTATPISATRTHMARTATITRATTETDIALTLALDGAGRAEIATGVGFLDHMLTALARHALFDLSVKAKG